MSLVRRAALAGLLLGGLWAPARAQIALSTGPAAAPAGLGANLGNPTPLDKGPWVLGEVLFFSGGKLVTDFALRDKVRGTRGTLYTRADIFTDADNLMSLGRFDKVTPSLYEIPSSPVPPEFTTIAASTSNVRLVFSLVEKAPAVAVSSAPARKPLPPASISGLILTPTAYRGAGRFTSPGLGLDINAVYVIGRLYGRNSFSNAPHSVNYIDRVGVWLLSADGKMQVQSEAAVRPAVAVGGQAAFMFRDSPQPNVNDPNPTVSVNASQKSTHIFTDAYFVASKKFGPVRSSLGLMQGNMGDVIANFTEFLSPDGLGFFAGHRGQITQSRTVPFVSFLALPKPAYPLGVEIMKFDGAPLQPILINFKIGYFLHLNFDVGYLKYHGGYDVLGLLQFRYNQFPSH